MISLKKYLDATQMDAAPDGIAQNAEAVLPLALMAYQSALQEMGKCGQDACPALGEGLKQGLSKLVGELQLGMSAEAVKTSEEGVREQLQNWGQSTAKHYRERTSEVKEILLVMARTAQSVGERDQRCARQIDEVTTRLKAIANLDDLTLIRTSIRKSAQDLKTSIDRMAAEGKAAIEQLRNEVSTYQTKLEEAESIASRDSLTGLLSRLCVENQIEQRIASWKPFCVALIDVDHFKRVNDEHGHLIGDELLKQFATELKQASRTNDLIGRWGGDEFLLVLDCGLPEAKSQIERLQKWVCGDYMLTGNAEPLKLRVDASIGLAEQLPGEALKVLVERADAEMYRNKAASRAAAPAAP